MAIRPRAMPVIAMEAKLMGGCSHARRDPPVTVRANGLTL
jgi:hypothetical protein